MKIDDDNEAKEYGLENLPVLIYFENKVRALLEPNISCDLSNFRNVSGLNIIF